MRKSVLYYIVSLIITITFVTLIIVQSVNPLFNLSASKIWFPLLCALTGVLLIFKAVFFKISSATWFGVNLILNGTMYFMSLYFGISYLNLWPTLLSFSAVASLTTYICFRNKIHYKIFAILFLLSIPCYLYSFNVLNWALSMALLITLIFIMIFSFSLKVKFLEDKKNG